MEIRDTRNGEWHWVYNALLADPHLTAGEKLVYSSISTFGGHQVIHPSKEQLADRCGLDAKTVQRALSRLEEVGYLSVERSVGRGNANVYFLLKKPKGCNLCPFVKGDIDDHKRGHLEPQKGTETTPYIYSIDKEERYILPEDEKPKKKPKTNLEGFEGWFTAYPNRTRKAEASAVWRDMSQEERNAAYKDTEGRHWGDPKFIPSALNYLKGKRWLDEKPTPRKIMSFGNKK